jgi:DNA-binding NarL/FixJ family response regulator
MGQEIRILLLHDQSLFREGLERLLRDEPGFQIVASCASTREALAALERVQADVVLVDYDVGEERGLDFVEELQKLGFDGRVLMVSARMSGGAVLRALERGTSGIFMRHSPPSELVKAIHRVVSGDLWLDSETMQAMVEAVRSGEQRIWQHLSARERVVLKAVLEGLTNHQIAVKLRIPESSVKYVIRKLFEKAGVRTRSQLVRIALERHAQDWLAAV